MSCFREMRREVLPSPEVRQADTSAAIWQTPVTPPGPKLKKESEMTTGTIRNYNDVRGYGFIETYEPGDAVFCHRSALDDSLPDSVNGMRVSFDVAPSPKHPGKFCASNVRAA